MKTPTPENKDQSKRVAQIALLEVIIKKRAAAIEAHELIWRQMLNKQVNRLAELRLQKLILVNQQRGKV